LGSAGQVRQQWEFSNIETASAWGNHTSNAVISTLQGNCELQISVSAELQNCNARNTTSSCRFCWQKHLSLGRLHFIQGKTILFYQHRVQHCWLNIA